MDVSERFLGGPKHEREKYSIIHYIKLAAYINDNMVNYIVIIWPILYILERLYGRPGGPFLETRVQAILGAVWDGEMSSKICSEVFHFGVGQTKGVTGEYGGTKGSIQFISGGSAYNVVDEAS